MKCSKCGKFFIPSGAGWLCDECLMAEFELNEDYEPVAFSQLLECSVCGSEVLECDLSTCTMCNNLICDDCIEYQDESVTFCEDCYKESE